jgi:hypothetical protein
MRRSLHAVVVASLVAVAAMGAGCKKDDAPSAPAGLLAKTTFKKGETITVTFPHAITGGPQENWLTLCAAGAPDSEWGAWHYVKPGSTTDTLTANAAGQYEVRLHDGYPRVQYHVVSRQKITIE